MDPAVRIWIETRLSPAQRAALAETMGDVGRPVAAWPLEPGVRRWAVDAACTRHVAHLVRCGNSQTAAIRITAPIIGMEPATLERRFERRTIAFVAARTT